MGNTNSENENRLEELSKNIFNSSGEEDLKIVAVPGEVLIPWKEIDRTRDK